MPEFGEMFDKAKDAVSEHSDQVSEGLDKGREFVDDKTGGKYGDQLQQGQEKVEGFMGGDDRGSEGRGDFGGQGSEGGYGGQGNDDRGGYGDRESEGGGYGGGRDSEEGYDGGFGGREPEGGDWR